jgi:hypothetical protein
MSGTYPSSPAFNSVNFKINTPVLRTQTISGKSRRVAMGHSFYTFTAKYNNISKYDTGPVIGFIAEQYGSLERFQIVLPEISYSKLGSNQTTTTVTTTAAVSAGVDHVSVTGVTSGKYLLRAGDYFKFNHPTDPTNLWTKVYMCTTSWVTGQPLYFSGSLVDDIPSGTSLTINAVPFTVILDGEVQQYDTGIGGIVQLSLDFRETW